MSSGSEERKKELLSVGWCRAAGCNNRPTLQAMPVPSRPSCLAFSRGFLCCTCARLRVTTHITLFHFPTLLANSIILSAASPHQACHCAHPEDRWRTTAAAGNTAQQHSCCGSTGGRLGKWRWRVVLCCAA